MRKMRSMVGLLLVALVAVGCNADSLTSAQVAGTWNLVRISGAALPATVQDSGGVKIVIQSDQFVLKSDGTWTETLVQVQTVNGVTSTVQFTPLGYYFLIDSDITLDFGDGTQAVGTIDGGNMTFGGGGSFTEVYTRQ